MLRKIFSYLFLTGLIVLSTWQMSYNWNEYIKPWFRENKGFLMVESPQRTGILIMGTENARAMRFLQAYLPADAILVMPPSSYVWWFSKQNIMQNFLFPRAILACCDEPKCECLTEPSVFTLAVKDFPAKSVMGGRTFVAYPEGDSALIGVYVPDDLVATLKLPEPETYGKTSPISIRALLFDIAITALFFILGSLLTAIILKNVRWWDLIETGLPFGIGVFSWVLFLVNYAGIPLATPTVWGLFFILPSILLGVYFLSHKNFPKFPKFEKISITSKDIPFLLLLSILLLMLAVSSLTSLGRGYSSGDDIVNWSMKGYVMADSGTIWTGAKYGGHILAYPMNLILSIATFRLIDGDVLPGSKFIFIFLNIALIAGSYRFLLRKKINKIWALMTVIAFFSMPAIFTHSTLGFANLPFTSYLVLGILNTLDGLQDFDKSQIAIGGFQLAFSAWTRPEGIMFAGFFIGMIYFMVWFIQKSKIPWKNLLISLSPLIIPATWLLLLGAKNMKEDQIGNALTTFSKQTDGLQIIFQAFGAIYDLAARTFTSTSFGQIFLFTIFIILAALPIHKWHKEKQHFTFAAITMSALLLPGFMFIVAAPNEIDYAAFLRQSFDRAYFPGLALSVLYASLLVARHE